MDHVVFLFLELLLEISSRVENKISWLQLLEFKFDRKGVKLVALIPAVDFEAQIVFHVSADLTRQSATI